MQVIAYIAISIYSIALVSVTGFCVLQFYLFLKYQRSKNNRLTPVPSGLDPNNLPFVTIQLPLYNEKYVVERLIDNIILMNYPRDKYEIQILDDSTDETVEICRRKVIEYAHQNFNIHHYHRTERAGFKAGALLEGLKFSKGEFIAIFDADFMPSPSFLLQTLPHFADPKTGVVQTRWDHINENYSLITRLQAFQLNVHFTIEQSGRNAAGLFLQFNGTAGVWRRQAILDAGGWQSDTLTEDLDLSYRAQLKGWNIYYRQDILSPAELPSEMLGLKSQQFRWMKGGAENARKLIPAVLKTDIPFIKKLNATGHLLSSTVFIFVFILGVMSVPALFLMNIVQVDVSWFGICMTGLLLTGCVYYAANRDAAWSADPGYRKILKFFTLFPLFLSLSMGLSLHNSIAVLQGYAGRKSVFVRTPKFNIRGIQDTVKQGLIDTNKITLTTLFEGLLSLYFLLAIIVSIRKDNTSFIIYHFMLMMGFGSIFFYSMKHALQR